MEINRITPEVMQFTARLSAIALKPKKLYYYGTMPRVRWWVQEDVLIMDGSKLTRLLMSLLDRG